MKPRSRFYYFTRAIRFFFQRLFRGWDDSETWNLNCSIAEYILPRLKRYKEINMVCWDDGVLEKMILAFEYYVNMNKYDDEMYGENAIEFYNKVNEGLRLFAKYYGSLWW